MADLSLRRVCKRYGNVEVIHGVDLEIKDGEFVVFVGPSGCGKSTLLRMIAGLEEITEGEFLAGGVRMNEVPPAQRKAAMVFQSYALYPHMTVYENLAFGLRTAGARKEVIEERVHRAAAMLQIEPYLQRRPRALSGGQRQRVAIGRAIVRDPELFLFDEPLSNLDAELRVQMRVELSKLHAELGTTMIYVTHDQVEAMTMADRIVVLRDGVIEQTGTPLDLYNKPRNQFVAGFIGSPKMNFIDGHFDRSSGETSNVVLGDGCRVEIPNLSANPPSGAALRLGIRPEHVRLSDRGMPYQVDLIEQLGGNTVVYGMLAGRHALVTQLAGQSSVRRGDVLHVELPRDGCHIFDAQGLNLCL